MFFRPHSKGLTREYNSLILIRAAGGVYDFQNFEKVYLCNGLSSELQNLCIPQKTSREYILLNTSEQKRLFRTAVKVYMTSGAARTVSSSF
jgi:hypothetical protein